MSSHISKSALASAASLSLVFIPLSALPANAQDAIQADTTSKTVTLLNINDFHGRISESIGMGLAGTIQSERAKNPTNTALLSAGDNVSASLFVSAIQDDEPTLDYLNALGLQASAVGNHEFDKGLADLTGRLSDKADFPYLGANVVDKATGASALEPYTIVTTEDGVKIGVIGTVTTEVPTLTDPSALASVNFTDPVAATNKYADQLSDGNPDNGEADIVVAEYHEGVDAANSASDPIVSNTNANVDVIFTGHTHEQYVIDGKIPGEATKTRPVIQTGNYGDNLGKVELNLASDGTVTAKSSELIKRGATPSDEAIAADPTLAKVQQILTDANAYATEEGTKVVAPLTAPVTTGWDSSKAGTAGNGFDQRDKESTMGHLVADMYLSAANSTGRTPADIGIVNPGGLRSEFPGSLRSDINSKADNVTVSDIVSVAPFANNLWTTKLTGAQLKSVLEEQWQADASGNMATRPYLQLGLSSNVTYTYTGEASAEGFAQRGNHIQDIYVNGKKVNATDTFTVAIPSFLLGGGDNFRTLSQGTESKDTALVDSDAFIAYLKDKGTVTPRYNKQAVKVNTAQASEGFMQINLSGLNLASYGVPETTSLDVYVDGAKVGSVPVAQGEVSTQLDISDKGIAEGVHEVKLVAPENIGTVVQYTDTFQSKATQRLSDIPASRQFSKEINWAAEAGITTGYKDGTFRPGISANRDAIAAFFYRAAGSPEFTAPATPSFSDVPTTHPFYKEIEWMKAEGITTGYKDGTFRPGTAVNRDAIAAFFYRAAGSPTYSAPATTRFSDVATDRQFYKEISWMASNAITTGFTDGTFRPGTAVNRDAIAAFIYRYANNNIGRGANAVFSTPTN